MKIGTLVLILNPDDLMLIYSYPNEKCKHPPEYGIVRGVISLPGTFEWYRYTVEHGGVTQIIPANRLVTLIHLPEGDVLLTPEEAVSKWAPEIIKRLVLYSRELEALI
ncbi:MAG: hypothetical protein A3C04_03655 [Candidatus Wildermuthbacteria bacterium RIFCSPHIGHO2_02_FULL_45_25]|uniref:Uncharacterized protein n=1 Tax=Candidatus Wildermuthbacteria bacterium RIFCSPHIGHO2_02_FULL_45_25 TaxID=1802450 RepID=A0A1G2R1G7_9BACT|nr:MAG: hypothetical protein A3C04_03655 [Candidatus Wildermuthbacteria bacterium RIFCSPHIGHO2_02_FULL_45_25]